MIDDRVYKQTPKIFFTYIEYLLSYLYLIYYIQIHYVAGTIKIKNNLYLIVVDILLIYKIKKYKFII